MLEHVHRPRSVNGVGNTENDATAGFRILRAGTRRERRRRAGRIGQDKDGQGEQPLGVCIATWLLIGCMAITGGMVLRHYDAYGWKGFIIACPLAVIVIAAVVAMHSAQADKLRAALSLTPRGGPVTWKTLGWLTLVIVAGVGLGVME